jgi:hypothetical protein
MNKPLAAIAWDVTSEVVARAWHDMRHSRLIPDTYPKQLA